MLPQQQAKTGPAMNRKARRAARRQSKKEAQRITLTRSTAALSSDQQQMLLQALAHQNEGRPAEAAVCYRQTLAADPNCAAAHFGLGLLEASNENYGAAYPHLKQAVVLDPEDPNYWSELGNCLSKSDQLQAAAIAYQNAIERKPDDAALLVNAAWAFYCDDQVERAADTYKQALRINRRYLPALIGLGQQHYSLGNKEQAKACFTKALKVDPRCPEAFFRLVDLDKDESALAKLIDGIERATGNRERDERTARLHFAAGKAHKRLKQHGQSFQHFATGNAILHDLLPFDRDEMVRVVDETIAAFQPEVFDALRGAASDSARPIFIVGMPRSGSTLVEQILSSHPEIEDAGEFPKLWNTANALRSNQGALSDPRDIARFETAPIAQLGTDYLEALGRGRAPDVARITDKLLGNFLHAGLISILFPKAAIVHCRRDPMACCFSSFTQMFSVNDNLAYTTDLADLGFYYRQYERLMAHWRSVLTERMIEIDYEVMVADQEATSRRLIDHVELPWSDACLEFYKTERNVRTASHTQVRQPIYNSSVEGWRAYETQLAPLKAALDEFATG